MSRMLRELTCRARCARISAKQLPHLVLTVPPPTMDTLTLVVYPISKLWTIPDVATTTVFSVALWMTVEGSISVPRGEIIM